MTSAKISTLAEGHGLTDTILDEHFAKYSKGEPIKEVVALCVIQVTGNASNNTKVGRHNQVKYELAKFEPVHDAGQSSDFRYFIQALYEARTTPDSQHALPLGLPGFADEEKRKAVIERIEAWAGEQDPPLTGAELDERWRNHFGIGVGEENSWGDRGVPSEYGRSPMTWLLEFALAVGAIDADEKIEVAPPAVFSSGADALDSPDDDPLAETGDDTEPDGE